MSNFFPELGVVQAWMRCPLLPHFVCSARPRASSATRIGVRSPSAAMTINRISAGVSGASFLPILSVSDCNSSSVEWVEGRDVRICDTITHSSLPFRIHLDQTNNGLAQNLVKLLSSDNVRNTILIEIQAILTQKFGFASPNARERVAGLPTVQRNKAQSIIARPHLHGCLY